MCQSYQGFGGSSVRSLVISSLAFLFTGLLTGCVTVTTTKHDPRKAAVPLSARPCEGKASGKCTFINAPVALSQQPIRLKRRPLPFYRTTHALHFVDAGPRRWIAPKATLTDGASIPDIFVPVIGNPRSQEFIDAATLHDAYCGLGNEGLAQYHSDTWQNVHHMFYDALRVGGTPARKAKIMYAAVYLAGPRWQMPGEGAKARMAAPGLLVISAPVVLGPGINRPLPDVVPEEALIAALEEVIAYINRRNPSLQQLDIRLMNIERRLLADAASAGPQGRGKEDNGNENLYHN